MNENESRALMTVDDKRFFADAESACGELARLVEEQEMDRLRDDIAALDPHTPFRRGRVVRRVGSPGTRGTCPACGYAGSKVDGWGAFTCDNCSFTNVDAPVGDDETLPPWYEDIRGDEGDGGDADEHDTEEDIIAPPALPRAA